MLTIYENQHATYEFRDSILYIIYKADHYIDYQAARKIVSDRLRIQSYKAFPIICDVSNVKGISSEAKEYLATYGSDLTKAVALISTKNTQLSLAEYFVTINKPSVPTKIFDNLEDAALFVKKPTKS